MLKPKEGIQILTCKTCGKDFERKITRGRRPKECSKCKDSSVKKSEKVKELRSKSSDGLTAVPIFREILSPDSLSTGDSVFSLPGFTSNDIIRRRFAREYKVLSVAPPMVEVVRNIKSGYKNYPTSVHFSRLCKKSGVEYLDIRSEDDIMMEPEGIVE